MTARPLADPTPTLAPAVAKTPGVGTVEARDAAIRARLRQGAAAFDELVALLPDADLSADERRLAANRAVMRMRIKGEIRHVQGDATRWELVA